MFDAECQSRFIELLLRGASPFGACQQMGISYIEFLKAERENATFHKACEDVHVALTRNVLAAVYRAAMEGNTTAQSLWLKACGPVDSTSTARGQDSYELEQLFDHVTDDELVQLAHALDVGLPDEVESRLSQAG